MSWQRPDIGSRVNQEVHARFWERPEVKFLRATRQNPKFPSAFLSQVLPSADIHVRTIGVLLSGVAGIWPVIRYDCERYGRRPHPRRNPMRAEFCSRPGVEPSQILRQFGISRTDVQKAIATGRDRAEPSAVQCLNCRKRAVPCHFTNGTKTVRPSTATFLLRRKSSSNSHYEVLSVAHCVCVTR
jgi:hypothetical protein